MDAGLLFENDGSMADIMAAMVAISKKYELQERPQSISFEGKWGKGSGMLFQPCSGLHFGTCGPLEVAQELHGEGFYERPVVACILVLSGSIQIQFPDKAKDVFDLRSRMFLIGKLSDLTMLTTTPVQKNYSHIGMVIEPNFFNTFFGNSVYQHLEQLLSTEGSPYPLSVRTGMACPDCIQTVKRLLTNDSIGSSIFSRHSILNVFMKLLLCLEQTPIVQKVYLLEDEVERMMLIKKDIEENFLLIDSVSSLYSKYGMNKMKIHHGFKHLFGISIAKYIHKCKMEYAHAMLREHKMNVSQIAFEIGYSNIGHFISAYKRIFGVTAKKTMQYTSTL